MSKTEKRVTKVQYLRVKDGTLYKNRDTGTTKPQDHNLDSFAK